MLELIRERLPEIADLCRRFRVERLDLFGSAANRAFQPEQSDLDFLVVFRQTEEFGPADQYFGLLFALEALFQRKVDLVELSALSNPYVRESALAERQALYAA